VKETPLTAYYRRIKAIKRGGAAEQRIWEEIDKLSAYEQGQYLFYKKHGDKTFLQITGVSI
jgi:uncharacterized protein YktA (UPF0223 family)